MSMESMEPFESAENFNEDVGMFEAATHSSQVNLTIPVLKSIFVVQDGSQQDPTAMGFAEVIASRCGASLEVISDVENADQILARIGGSSDHMMVLPVPFGQDYDELAHDSLGAVVDQVLLKSGGPVLCIREPQDPAQIQAALNSVIVPIVISDELASKAVSWGFFLTPAGGRIDLVAIADRADLEGVQHLVSEEMRTIHPDQLSRAMTREIGGLVSAAQKRGSAEGRTIHVETRVGNFVPTTLHELHDRPHMLICGITHEHSAASFHRGVDLLLESRGAVLFV